MGLKEARRDWEGNENIKLVEINSSVVCFECGNKMEAVFQWPKDRPAYIRCSCCNTKYCVYHPSPNNRKEIDREIV